MVAESAMYDRPIAERHRLIFYLGNLDAFDGNIICRDAFEQPPFHPQFDRLFASGIDPVNGPLPADGPADWPSIDEVHAYNARARQDVDECLQSATFVNSQHAFTEKGKVFWAVIEHRLMHVETLSYMFHWLPAGVKHGSNRASGERALPPAPRQVHIPAGGAMLGFPSRGPFLFGWDNEFERHSVAVPEFLVDAYNVNNEQYLEFLNAGGYQERSLWTDDAWEWIRNSGVKHPRFWIETGNGWLYKSMFEDIPLPLAWPVYVSHAEASAYVRWAGKSLPTESQFHRAAFGSPGGSERLFAWGDSLPEIIGANFDFRSWTPDPVGSGLQSSFGVHDLVGNGWEWTSTVFEPFPGFKPFPFYPGYSFNFFDGKHYVLKGASPRTAALLIRPSFRNWFQPFYPNVYATFRCVET